MDDGGPLVSLVENLATRDVFEATRGRGATRNGQPIHPAPTASSTGALVAVNGILTSRPQWGQIRTLGSAALELCLVADGSLDGYVQVGGAAIHPWDYLAGIHIVQEAGGAVRSSDGEDLYVREAVPRRPLAAATQVLADQLLEDLAGL
jgi:myo-inositol-1(or 4)-monophosphatase